MNGLYMFRKSGSIVERVVQTDDGGTIISDFDSPPGHFTVRRIDTGKKMTVTINSLIPLKELADGTWVTDDLEQTEIRVPRRLT